MTRCNLCPRACNADRDVHPGYCGAGVQPVIARFMLHQWEEPCISGTGGAGAVFFCGCNLNCIFCQNYKINHHMEVLDKDDRPIGGLYAIGNDAGGAQGDTYNFGLPGSSFGFALSSGFIAAENAVRYLDNIHP